MADEQLTNGEEKRRRIALTSIDGHTASIRFYPGTDNEVVANYDVRELPGAEKASPYVLSLLAMAAVSVMQVAYSVKGVANHPATADAKWRELMSGEWRPGRVYSGLPAESDALAMAFCQYRESIGKPLTPAQFEAQYVPLYMEQMRVKSVAAAKRAIGAVPEIAAIRARILADRAKAAAGRAKGAHSPSLPDLVA